MTKEDWAEWKESISFDYIEDNYFSELKEAEMYRERFEMLSSLDEFMGTFISKEWVQKNILRFNDDDIETMQKQIDDEGKESTCSQRGLTFVTGQSSTGTNCVRCERPVHRTIKCGHQPCSAACRRAE